MAGGGVPEPDLKDARAEAGVEDQDPLLLELPSPQLLSVHPRVRDADMILRFCLKNVAPNFGEYFGEIFVQF